MTFLSVLEVIALFAIAGAGWRCAHWLLVIAGRASRSQDHLALQCSELRKIKTLLSFIYGEVETQGKAQKTESK